MNVVYNEHGVILDAKQLAEEANAITRKRPFTEKDFSGPDSRIQGTGHCNCAGNGVFELLPKDAPEVIEGGKRYMRCKICGGWSHL